MNLRGRLAGVVERVRAVPRPTVGQLLRVSPLVVVVVAMVALVGRGHDTVEFPDYAVPEGFVPRPPPTTAAPGAQLPSLPGVAGTTEVEVPPNRGSSRLVGTVTGPTGAVAGAVVRVERTILGTTQVLDVATDAAGGWSAAGIGGGRYRVRAFLPPFLSSRTAEVFLLPAGESRTLALVVEEFNQPTVALASAPAPALLDQQVNVAVRVVGRFVDADGFVSVQPLAGAIVDVTTSASWVRSSPDGAVLTDGNGQAVLTFTCRQLGAAQVTATVRVDSSAAPLVAQGTYDCIDPATLVPTTQPGGGEPPLSSTTSTTTATPPTQPG